MAQNILLGVACLDIYTRTGQVRPGCGIVHNAFHLQQLGCRPLLVTRVGQADSQPLLNFFQANQISVLPELVMAGGDSASIEIDVQSSGEAIISNFKLGVWESFRLRPAEEKLLNQATNLHLVLARGVIPEFRRVSENGLLRNVHVSADFLAFADFSLDSFAALLPYVNLAFIGWKGDPADPTITALAQLAQAHQVLIVITYGDRGIQAFDARRVDQFQRRFFNVEKVEVRGNTNGCGDAFIAYFLAEYWRSHDLEKAIAQGKIGGALATQWRFALPDEAYGESKT